MWTAVTISYGLGASEAGSNDASGTVRVHGENVALYNLNIENSFGKVGRSFDLYICIILIIALGRMYFLFVPSADPEAR